MCCGEGNHRIARRKRRCHGAHYAIHRVVKYNLRAVMYMPRSAHAPCTQNTGNLGDGRYGNSARHHSFHSCRHSPGHGCATRYLSSLLPFRYRGACLGPWLTYFISHIFNRIFNVHFTCTDRGAMMRHRGLIVANHSSYLDVVVIVNAAPICFLAAKEIQRQPVIGRFAMAQETVFVDRSSRVFRARRLPDAITAALQKNPIRPSSSTPRADWGWVTG